MERPRSTPPPAPPPATPIPELRTRLLAAQERLRAAGVPVLIVVGGVDGAGKGEVANRLCRWMDPRWMRVHTFDDPSDEELARPRLWRFFRVLPPRGRIGIFLGAWHSRPLVDRASKAISKAEYRDHLERIRSLESMLVADGMLIVKLWLHLGKEDQRERFEELESDPLTRWRVSPTDWEHWRLYDAFIKATDQLLDVTYTPDAPWEVIDARDRRQRDTRVADILVTRVERRLASPPPPAAAAEPPADPAPGAADSDADGGGRRLRSLDMSLALQRDEYSAQLAELRARANALQRRARELGVSSVAVFEGWDASGKGGAIHRLTSSLDARDYRVVRIAAPTDEERARHYLWRFWRHLPRAGRLTIFDRSYYGRVLVERVEGFASTAEWQRAYAEIDDFERDICDHGVVLCKFWMHITPDEQEARFRERARNPHKSWKLTAEDWRNRAKWSRYEDAAEEMLARTSTAFAPWTVVEADDKRFARVKVLQTFCDRLTAGVERAEGSG